MDFRLKNILSKFIGYNKTKSYPLIAETGGWTGYNEHFFDSSLGEYLSRFIDQNEIKDLSDLGSGSEALYSLAIKNKNRINVSAFDYNPEILNIKEIPVARIDLTKECKIEGKELVLFLEVGEHIPREYMNQLFDNVTSASKRYVILSWAIIGQTGHGHVNCLTNFDVIEQMNLRGFELNIVETRNFRNSASLDWFKNTLLVFKKISQA